MAFQFIHVSTYSRQKPKKAAKGKDRKWTVSDVAAEADREPEHSHHVDSPAPPAIVFGCSAGAAAAEAEKRAEASKDVRGRKIRADTPVMIGGVASHHFTVDDLSDAQKLDEYNEWKRLSVEFLQKKYGKNLLSIVEHKDEDHPHLHFYVVPEAGVGFNAKKLHDGYAAGDAASNPAQQKELYNAAMRKMQDEYHAQVGVKCGQARLGPQRRRMSRAEWMQEQHTLNVAKDAYMSLKRYVNDTRSRARMTADKIVSDAKASIQSKAFKATSWLDALRGNFKDMLNSERRKAEKERAAREKAEREAKDAVKRAETAEASAIKLKLARDEQLDTAVQNRLQPLQKQLVNEREKSKKLESQLDELSSENADLKRAVKQQKQMKLGR
jgi:hypothetical protein